MAKAIADPEEIRRFAHDLKRFNDDLTHQLQVMRSRMSSLSQSWRDQDPVSYTHLTLPTTPYV